MGDIFPRDGFMLINTRLIKLFMALKRNKIGRDICCLLCEKTAKGEFF